MIQHSGELKAALENGKAEVFVAFRLKRGGMVSTGCSRVMSEAWVKAWKSGENMQASVRDQVDGVKLGGGGDCIDTGRAVYFTMDEVASIEVVEIQ